MKIEASDRDQNDYHGYAMANQVDEQEARFHPWAILGKEFLLTGEMFMATVDCRDIRAKIE